MTREEYFAECIQCALAEHGITLEKDVLLDVASAVETARQNMHLAYHVPECDNGKSEIARLTRELQDERRKRVCEQCGGSGETTIPGPCHVAISRCSACGGSGKR